ncbi:hypothetical protein EDD86DRAFT_218266 [Gorgonomyces haynaldii]|nr:hypothetical protein EDD86DRAFT_218266 [Gorgonomyces haynaldii]
METGSTSMQCIQVQDLTQGLVHTDAYRGFAGFLGGEDGLFGKILHLIWNLGSPLCLTPEQGAVAVLYAATSPEIENEGYKGRYMLPFGHVTGKMSALASDNALSEQLWKFSKAVLEQVLG